MRLLSAPYCNQQFPQLSLDMATNTNEIVHEFPPFFKVYKDGRIERFMVHEHLPPNHDPLTGVQSKDVVISPETGLTARLFIPKFHTPDQKLPLVVHYHGGGFCVGSPFDVVSNNFLRSISSQAHVISISIDYRLAPEHPLPIAYDDSWAALQWIAAHSNGAGPESVLNNHVDFKCVFLAGESAGANIAHHVAVRAGVTGLAGLEIDGVMIVHPFFVGEEQDEMYKFMCPTSSGCSDDPRLNPAVDPNISKMAGNRVLVCLAEKDGLKSRGLAYYDTLGKSDWNGNVDLIESNGEDHCFHLFDRKSEQARMLMDRIVSFINHK